MQTLIEVVISRDNTLYPSMILSVLQTEKLNKFKITPLDTLLTSPQLSTSATYLFFMSYDESDSILSQLRKITEQNRKCYTVIYDAPHSLPTSDLINLGRLKGYFVAGISALIFQTKVKAILNGDSFLPVVIAHQLIDYYQSLIIRFTEPHSTNLTQREIQVLIKLRCGYSNNRLADELFVSENTIKSHLYKIFKKLSVANRNQAIEWAHKYLP